RYVDHYEADAPEHGSQELRKVIVFRLEQLSGGELPGDLRTVDRLNRDPVVELPIEETLSERSLIEGDRELHEGERRGQELTEEFVPYLQRQGHELCRLQLTPEREAAPLYCDLFDK